MYNMSILKLYTCFTALYTTIFCTVSCPRTTCLADNFRGGHPVLQHHHFFFQKIDFPIGRKVHAPCSTADFYIPWPIRATRHGAAATARHDADASVRHGVAARGLHCPTWRGRHCMPDRYGPADKFFSLLIAVILLSQVCTEIHSQIFQIESVLEWIWHGMYAALTVTMCMFMSEPLWCHCVRYVSDLYHSVFRL